MPLSAHGVSVSPLRHPDPQHWRPIAHRHRGQPCLAWPTSLRSDKCDDYVRCASCAGVRSRIRLRPMAAPMSWARMNPLTEAGAMPAKVLEKIRPTGMAGFGKPVELVIKYAAPI